MELIILLLVISVLFKIFKPNLKGYLGEREVSNLLRELPNDQYKVLDNVMIRTEFGTTQIDHIVLSRFGIFVIETKNYKGWITGGEFSDTWTKNMYGNKYSFQNPLKQNYAHVKALEKLLKLEKDIFIPIVTFSKNSNIKVNTRKPVVYFGQIKWVIQTYKEEKISEEELENITKKILNCKITDKTEKKEHTVKIQQKIKRNKIMSSRGICPKCGGLLIPKKGKYGNFRGCSLYPNCRYTEKI